MLLLLLLLVFVLLLLFAAAAAAIALTTAASAFDSVEVGVNVIVGVPGPGGERFSIRISDAKPGTTAPFMPDPLPLAAAVEAAAAAGVVATTSSEAADRGSAGLFVAVLLVDVDPTTAGRGTDGGDGGPVAVPPVPLPPVPLPLTLEVSVNNGILIVSLLSFRDGG
jgi:hypothetical protein